MNDYDQNLDMDEKEHLLEEKEVHEYDTAPRRDNSSTYEEAISKTGYGRFHYFLVILCGWSVSSDAVEILSISFVIPPATCDLGLTDVQKGWINSSVFIGMMVGGYFWGTLADMRGRRAVLVWSLSVNALGGLASSLAQSYPLFLAMRIISGLGVGGSMPVIFTYFTEFQPKEKRGAMISVLATFWMGGNIIAASFAWIIIPLNIGVNTGSFLYNSWRIYLALCVLPALTSAIMYAIMPESPKFLMMQGKEYEALAVLRRIYKSNNSGKSIGEYEITSLMVDDKSSSGSFERGSFERDGGIGVRITAGTKKFVSSTVDLFKPPLTQTTIIMVIIYATLSFGYYGLFMWFPELFQRMDKFGGSPCNLGNKEILVLNSTDPSLDCKPSANVYFEGFLTAISNLPGNILTIFIIDKVGRKLLLSSSMVLSGVCVFLIYALNTKTQSLIMSCVFSGISVIGWNALDVINNEVFPTNLRSTAQGVLMGIGRIAAILGNTVFGALVTVNCAVPMVMVAVFLGIGGLSALKLPNMTRRDLL